jgi:hypothetical protein
VRWNLKRVVAIGVPSLSTSGEVFGAKHFEPFTFMHVRDGIFPASHGFVLTKRKDDGIIFALFLVGVEDLLWVTSIIHFGCKMYSNPVEWLTESTKRLSICLGVLMDI